MFVIWMHLSTKRGFWCCQRRFVFCLLNNRLLWYSQITSRQQKCTWTPSFWSFSTALFQRAWNMNSLHYISHRGTLLRDLCNILTEIVHALECICISFGIQMLLKKSNCCVYPCFGESKALEAEWIGRDTQIQSQWLFILLQTYRSKNCNSSFNSQASLNISTLSFPDKQLQLQNPPQ